MHLHNFFGSKLQKGSKGKISTKKFAQKDPPQSVRPLLKFFQTTRAINLLPKLHFTVIFRNNLQF